MKILITGTAGFIGFHLTKKMLDRGDEVIGIDNINDYYDVDLKYCRLTETGIEKIKIEYGKSVKSAKYDKYTFVKMDLMDRESINKLFEDEHFDAVCNLAAQAGVRYSLENPYAYIDSNITGYVNLLEAIRHNPVKHFVYASSSSVYGLNKKTPFSTSDNVDHPISLYAASKKSNELMAHTYSHLFNIPVTGLRFFTVYGPWGRPDMAYFLFTRAILENKPIDVFNNGNMKRDFTYIDDIIEGIIRVIDNPSKGNSNKNGMYSESESVGAPYQLYNIGNNKPIKLIEFIESIEENLERKAEKRFLPMQPGDVIATWADVDDLIKDVKFKPETDIKTGMKKFIKWYKEYYDK